MQGAHEFLRFGHGAVAFGDQTLDNAAERLPAEIIAACDDCFDVGIEQRESPEPSDRGHSGREVELPPRLPEGRHDRATQNGQTITSDGTVGGIDATPGSFYVFEAEDKDATIAFAARIPAARIGGAVEVRPVGMYW